MMNHKTTRTWTAILAALALSLLLTACGKSGDTTPTGDNTTPGVIDTQTPNTRLDNATESDNTSGTADSTPSGTSEMPEEIEESKYKMPPYDEAWKAEIDEHIAAFNNASGIDIENILDKVYEKYRKYLNVNMTKDVIRIGIVTGTGSSYYKSFGGNETGISPDAMKKVNDFLAANGEGELDSGISEQNIAALWIAASLYYDPDFVGEDICDDIARPFGLARANPSIQDNAEILASSFWSSYVSLFGGPFVLEEALK